MNSGTNPTHADPFQVSTVSPGGSFACTVATS
jgi:hypothetical protein